MNSLSLTPLELGSIFDTTVIANFNLFNKFVNVPILMHLSFLQKWILEFLADPPSYMLLAMFLDIRNKNYGGNHHVSTELCN